MVVISAAFIDGSSLDLTMSTLQTLYHSVFFFFQAEDGIRDYKVTGVQTCALPIYTLSAAVELVRTGGAHARAGPRQAVLAESVKLPGSRVLADGFAVISSAALVPKRSEERRVGKECRSRWSPYH